MKELFIPERWRGKFEIKDLVEKEKELNLILIEKADLVPSELAGKELAEFFRAWDNLRYIREKDFQVVQRGFKWFWQC